MGEKTLTIPVRTPYLWSALITFLEDRAIHGAETVIDDVYHRTLAVDGHAGWFSVSFGAESSALALTISGSLAPVTDRVVKRVMDLFDTHADPQAVHEHLGSLADLDPRMPAPGLRVPGAADPFEMGVRAVLGQQITVAAARTIASRLAHDLGEPITTPIPGLDRIFLQPERVVALGDAPEDTLGALGVTRNKSRAIAALAHALLDGTITLSPDEDVELQKSRLLALFGFGPWTVDYVALRSLKDPDILLHTDYGVKLLFPDTEPARIVEHGKAWAPYGSYATMNIWHLLSRRGEDDG